MDLQCQSCQSVKTCENISFYSVYSICSVYSVYSPEVCRGGVMAAHSDQVGEMLRFAYHSRGLRFQTSSSFNFQRQQFLSVHGLPCGWWIMVNHGESYSFIQFRFFRMASASQAKLSMMTWWPINNCQSWTWIPMCTSWKQFLRRAVWTSFESFSNWKSSSYHPDQVQQSARFERNDTKCLRDPETELLKNIYFNDIEPVEGCRGCSWHRRLQSFSRRRTILLHRRIWTCDPSRSIVCTGSWYFTVPFQVVWGAATETQVYFGISQTF
jgi:hypothetical protein